MKKTFSKMLGAVLVFVLLLGVATPVYGATGTTLRDYGQISFPELPSSFDFEMSYNLRLNAAGEHMSDELTAVFALFAGDGFAVDVSGTWVTEGLTSSLYTEISIDLEGIFGNLPVEVPAAPLLAMLSIDVNEPFRFWIESDFSNLSEPVYLIVMEMPAILRMAATLFDPGLSSQFWVLDLSELLAELAAEFEAEIRQITDEQAEEMWMYIEEALEEAWAEIEALMEELAYELAYYIEQFANMFTLRHFDFGEIYQPYGFAAFLNLVFTIEDAGDRLDVDFAFVGEVTNLNTAEAVPLPELTAENSLDLLEWIVP